MTALAAGRFHAPGDPRLGERLAAGEAVLLDELGFDSLAWMEFCISVELQTRQELLTSDIEAMETVADIEDWLGKRI